jgi:hypothetical protein
MSMSLTLTQEQIERLLGGFDSITMGLDAVRSALSESVYAQQPLQGLNQELGVPSVDSIRWRSKGGADASPGDAWAFVFAKNRDGSTPSDLIQMLSYLASHGGRFDVNGYEVSVSKDGKFINRKKL